MLGINPVMTELIQGYTNADFVGNFLFPQVPVNTRNGQIRSFGKDLFEDRELTRAPGAPYAAVDIGFEGIPYSLKQDAVRINIPFEYIEDAESVAMVDLPELATGLEVEMMYSNLEKQQAKLARTASSYPTANVFTPQATDRWDDPASDPEKQVIMAREIIRQRTAKNPNVVVMGPAAFNALTVHPKLQDLKKYTTTDSIDTTLLARWFKVDAVYVGNALGAVNGVTYDIWGSDVIMAYVPKITNKQVPAFGYTYVRKGFPLVMNALKDENNDTFFYKAKFERNPYIVGNESGVLFQNVASGTVLTA
ncbi:hypothetical protein AQ750_04660 [Burkholderia pseudomallei]|nr:hypothetical protein AQ736_03380 [Burkholderia pseudomallei]OMS96431.1 hypothetical protein AQ750_04660 [Burkholderia pseudomallei]OMV27162.1 hypothetical protein AQ787_14160 [Burkholderia pseudomallei]